jgi:arsenate reductase-like glutaredoxin family protein
VEFIDVLKDASGMAAMLHHSQNQRRVPVIVADGNVTIGFDGGS